jgi:hypothetical protein
LLAILAPFGSNFQKNRSFLECCVYLLKLGYFSTALAPWLSGGFVESPCGAESSGGVESSGGTPVEGISLPVFPQLLPLQVFPMFPQLLPFTAFPQLLPLQMSPMFPQLLLLQVFPPML